MNRITIERKRCPSPEEFARDHLQGPGRPVVVTDAINRWPAMAKWDFGYFRTAYGSDFVRVSLGLDSALVKLTKFTTFIDYMDKPAGDMGGFWLNREDGTPLRTDPAPSQARPYLMDWSAFQRHPELYEDIVPALAFIDDWQLALSPTLRDVFELASARELFSIYIGAEGALSWLHQDYWHTHGYLAQIRGRKHCLLFSPEDSEFLYDGAVDPEHPDFSRFELFARASAVRTLNDRNAIIG